MMKTSHLAGAVILFCLFIALLHGPPSLLALRRVARWRAVPLDATVDLTVYRIDERGPRVLSPAFTVRTPDIGRGLHLLTSATGRPRDHEQFSDGYLMELRFRGRRPSQPFCLAVYRMTDRDMGCAPLDVVIPLIGNAFGADAKHAGEYSCPAFHAWVRETIDPIFSDGEGACRSSGE
jgi:hypothetical protein